jgi:hypothetical protein
MFLNLEMSYLVNPNSDIVLLQNPRFFFKYGIGSNSGNLFWIDRKLAEYVVNWDLAASSAIKLTLSLSN